MSDKFAEWTPPDVGEAPDNNYYKTLSTSARADILHTSKIHPIVDIRMWPRFILPQKEQPVSADETSMSSEKAKSKRQLRIAGWVFLAFAVLLLCCGGFDEDEIGDVVPCCLLFVVIFIICVASGYTNVAGESDQFANMTNQSAPNMTEDSYAPNMTNQSASIMAGSTGMHKCVTPATDDGEVLPKVCEEIVQPCVETNKGSITQNSFGWKRNLHQQMKCRLATNVVMLDSVPGDVLVEWDKEKLEHDIWGARVNCADAFEDPSTLKMGTPWSIKEKLQNRKPNELYNCYAQDKKPIGGFNFLVKHDKGPKKKKMKLKWHFGYEIERDWSSGCAITRKELYSQILNVLMVESSEWSGFILANLFFTVIIVFNSCAFYITCTNDDVEDFKEIKKSTDLISYFLLLVPTIILLVYSLQMVFASENAFEEGRLGMFAKENLDRLKYRPTNTLADCTDDEELFQALQDIAAKLRLKQMDGISAIFFIGTLISSCLTLKAGGYDVLYRVCWNHEEIDVQQLCENPCCYEGVCGSDPLQTCSTEKVTSDQAESNAVVVDKASVQPPKDDKASVNNPAFEAPGKQDGMNLAGL